MTRNHTEPSQSTPSRSQVWANRRPLEGKGCYCASVRASCSGGPGNEAGPEKDAERRDKASTRAEKESNRPGRGVANPFQNTGDVKTHRWIVIKRNLRDKRPDPWHQADASLKATVSWRKAVKTRSEVTSAP